jgi:hypothetical protein
MKKSELRALIREAIEEINLQEIDPVVKDAKSGQWKTEVPGIKVFFDITKFNLPVIFLDLAAKLGGNIPIVARAIKKGQEKLNPDKQTSFGSGIQIVNKIIHGDLQGVNHAGFVMSDGRILDAVTSGVGFRDGSEIKDNPQNYIIFNLGGDESKIIKAYEQLKSMLKAGEEGYDSKGIIRQIKEKFPKMWNLVNRFKKSKINAEETGQDQFFCSEFVAHLLARAGIISVDELVSAQKVAEEVDLEKLKVADEIDPQQLFNLIKSKAKLLDVATA